MLLQTKFEDMLNQHRADALSYAVKADGSLDREWSWIDTREFFEQLLKEATVVPPSAESNPTRAPHTSLSRTYVR